MGPSVAEFPPSKAFSVGIFLITETYSTIHTNFIMYTFHVHLVSKRRPFGASVEGFYLRKYFSLVFLCTPRYTLRHKVYSSPTHCRRRRLFRSVWRIGFHNRKSSSVKCYQLYCAYCTYFRHSW